MIEDTIWCSPIEFDAIFQVKGNIYCNDAGSKSWWGGEKTDFTIGEGAMKCEAGDDVLIIM